MLNAFAHLAPTKSIEASSLTQCSNDKAPSIHCGNTPSVVFDDNNRLWAVFEFNDFVYLTYSDDMGKQFSTPEAVNTQPEKVYTNGENRPKIVMGHKGEIYITWNQQTPGFYTGDIRFSRSIDQGKTFSPITTVNDDGLPTGHRFETTIVAKDGTIYMSWVDKRDNFKAKMLEKSLAKKQAKSAKPEKHKEHKKHAAKSSAAIYYAFSTDSGKSFSKNKKITDNSCVCCRIAMTSTNDGNIALFWRQIFGENTRDHAFAKVNKYQVSQPAIRTTYDNWNIDACPHHGPSLSQDSQDNFHMVWFTASNERKGIFYGQYDSTSNKMKNLVNISNRASASHPFISNNSEVVTIVWKEFDGENTNVYLQSSMDHGENWNTPQVLASTSEGSDHPLLTRQQEKTWLSWHTKDEGLRLFQLH